MTASEHGVQQPRVVRLEARVHAVLERRLARRGWTPVVVPFIGYGHDGWVRVLARVHVVPPGGVTHVSATDTSRGWRQYMMPSLAGIPVSIRIGDQGCAAASLRKGYIDVRLEADLEPGWATAQLSVGDCEPVLCTRAASTAWPA